MLTISPAVTVTEIPNAFPGTTNDYILFPDSDDKDMYYALAEFPTFLADAAGNPNFNLTWYYGTGELAGGVCTLTVALPVPNMADDAVRNKIAAAISGDRQTRKVAQTILRLCQAMEAGNTASVDAVRKELGYTEAMANEKKAVFDKKQGWEQFLPITGNLRVRPIPFKSGCVTIQAFKDDASYKESKPEFTSGEIETTPSLINSNAAVVTFSLEDRGANIFWQALGGPSLSANAPPTYQAVKAGKSIITATYTVEFDGLLPAAKATVTLKRDVVAKLLKERRSLFGWGHISWDQFVGKSFEEAIHNSTEIFLPAVATADDKESVQKLLTDWAAKQLEDMAKSQLPAVKLEDLNANSPTLQTLQQQSRTYSLTQATAVTKSPQGQLPKISSLLKPGADPWQFFHLINMNEKPYFNVDLTVRPPSLTFLKSRQIQSFVITNLTFGKEKLRKASKAAGKETSKEIGKEVSSLEYTTGKNVEEAEADTLSGTFSKKDPDKTLRYSYEVTYTDNTPSLRLPTQNQTEDANYLNLGGLDLGVLAVTFDPIDLPWDVLTSAKVELKYDTWQKTVTIKGGTAPLEVVKPFGKLMDKPLKYTLTLVPSVGPQLTSPEAEVQLNRGTAEVLLKNPLGTTKYGVSFRMDEEVEEMQMKVEYRMSFGSGPMRVFQQTIRLDKNNQTASWNLPGDEKESATFHITKTRVKGKDKVSRDLPAQEVAVGRETELTVTVMPTELDLF